MPVPTDTFWNIRRLNAIFAVSSLLLLGMLVAAVLQDYDKTWRQPQRSGRVWEAALVEEKLDRELPGEKQKRLEALDAAIAKTQADLESSNAEYKSLSGQIRQWESDKSNIEFELNNKKANLSSMETHLQDAIARQDAAEEAKLEKEIAGPRKEVAEASEKVAKLGMDLKEAREKLARATGELARLKKQRSQQFGDAEALRKKLVALQPKGILAKLSDKIRSAPLFQFDNPVEKVQQAVLPEVRAELGGFKQVDTVDRCMTCHVNIEKKEFTREKVIAYLEEQAVTGRKYDFPRSESAKNPLPTLARPGPAALPEFWLGYAKTVLPASVFKAKLEKSLNTIGLVGGRLVRGPGIPGDLGRKIEGIGSLKGAQREQVAAERDGAIGAIVEQLFTNYDKWYAEVGKSPAVADAVAAVKKAASDEEEGGEAKKEKPSEEELHKQALTALQKQLRDAREAAMTYPATARTALLAALPETMQRILDDRYRFALVGAVNPFRKQQGLAALDPSPVMLAHPRLDLYVDVDSKHSIEAVGCTACHDGSGQETNFVLAAHAPRRIWVDEKTGEPVLPQQLKNVKAEEHRPTMGSMLAAVYPGGEEGSLVPVKVGNLHIELEEAKEPGAAANSMAEAEVAEDAPATAFVDPAVGTNGTAGKAVSQAEYWAKKYESESGTSFEEVYHMWDWPMRPPEYIQANCVRCHTDPNEVASVAPVVHKGRYLFAHLGCVNCHQMDSVTPEALPGGAEVGPGSDIRLIASNGQRKVGTDLRHVTGKLSPAFINSWVWAPKAFRPSTLMPHFFMLENSSSDEEIRRTRQEARAITEYLSITATPLPVGEKVPADVTGDKVRGQTIFNSLGCLACHTNLGDQTTEKRAGKAVTLGEKWIVNDLVKRGIAKAEASKQYDAMSYNERQVYCLEHFGATTSGDTAPKYDDGTPKPIFMHHGPELSGIGTKLLAGRKTEEARQWLFDWVKNPRHYSEYTVMPRLRLSDQQALDLVEYLLDQKRTNDRADDKWTAELTPVDGAKLTELTAFFLRSRFSIQVADQKAVDDRELTALATLALTSPTIDPKVKERVSSMDVQQKQMVFLGQKLISHYGCMQCHAINGAENLSSPCANLSDWGQKSVDKLDYGFLDAHKVHELPETSPVAMVNGLSVEAANLGHGQLDWSKPIAAVVKPAWPELEHTRMSWLSQKLKNTRIFDRGRALLEPQREMDGEKAKLDGSGNPILRERGKPYDKLKMPTFYLNDEEVHAIVTFVISNRFLVQKDRLDRLIGEKLLAKTNNETMMRIARGREVAHKYNCVNCHVIERNAPSVQQWFKSDEITTRAPPSLRGEGNKVQFGWLFNFIKNVEPLRPLPVIRMPSFPITDQEVTDLAAYFSAVSNKESDELKTKIDLVMKYVGEQQEAAIKPVTMPEDVAKIDAAAAKAKYDELLGHAGARLQAQQWDEASETLKQAKELADGAKLVDEEKNPLGDSLDDAITAVDGRALPDNLMLPGSDWINRPAFATIASDLADWALATKQQGITASSLDPSRNSPTELARTYRTILFQARFTQELYASPYPFVDQPRPEISEERFKLGEEFFHQMQCLKCHIMGDPGAAGAAKSPTAPNLMLAQRRLQRRWVRHWVQEPPIIQANTAMPPFFTGLPINKLDGQSWPRAQGVPDAEAIEAKYGKTAQEQTDLLLDFLYAAGVRNYTTVMPTAGAKPAPGPTSKPAAETVKPAVTPVAGEKPGTPGISGRVFFIGAAPKMAAFMFADPRCAAKNPNGATDQTVEVNKNGTLKGVIVYVSAGVPAGAGDKPPTKPATLDQDGCMYHPHVLAMQIGQTLMLKNSDQFLHNVHSLAEKNPAFNFAQPGKGSKPVKDLKVFEIFHVKCDVHPWMSAYIGVFDHPYFAVTGEDGTFLITGLPPGKYTLTAWQEKYGMKDVEVKVEAGKGTTAEFSFKDE